MIGFLTGTIREKGTEFILIDVAGVGYQLFLSSNSLSGLPSAGEVATVYTYMHVRDDAIQLFGFQRVAEKELFQRLIQISGIGPKVAMGVLSAMDPDRLTKAIISGDVDLITSVPGIGKKTAQRVVLELKEKLVDIGTVNERESKGPPYMEARDALVGLGYSMQEASLVLDNCKDELSAEDYIKEALKSLGG